MAYMQKGDTGVLIEVTITDTDESTPYDISAATTKQIWLGSPGGVYTYYDASFGTDGTDGVLQYATSDDDINEAGTWNVQAYFEIDSNVRHSTVAQFDVYANLE